MPKLLSLTKVTRLLGVRRSVLKKKYCGTQSVPSWIPKLCLGTRQKVVNSPLNFIFG